MASAAYVEEGPGFLNCCLLGGDAVQERRARRVQRRALLASILLQILIVATLVLMPLLSQGENIAGRVIATPTVPYTGGGSRNHAGTQTRPQGNRQPACRFCQPPSIPPSILMVDNAPATPLSDADAPDIPGSPTGPGGGGPPGILDPGGRTSGPIEKTDGPQRTVRIRVTTIEPAMLIRRVEPVYPLLAKHLGREGRVELHAIVATDGSIQSLEVISGDPLLIQSALAAVREWRYRPTILNGQAVEVDTHITVIYTLSH